MLLKYIETYNKPTDTIITTSQRAEELKRSFPQNSFQREYSPVVYETEIRKPFYQENIDVLKNSKN